MEQEALRPLAIHTSLAHAIADEPGDKVRIFGNEAFAPTRQSRVFHIRAMCEQNIAHLQEHACACFLPTVRDASNAFGDKRAKLLISHSTIDFLVSYPKFSQANSRPYIPHDYH